MPAEYINDAQYQDFKELTQPQKDAVDAILGKESQGVSASFSDVANIDFTKSSSESGDISFGRAPLPLQHSAHAYYPVSSHPGDIWINKDLSPQSTVHNPMVGTFGYWIVLHEVGHALGLEHSFKGFTWASEIGSERWNKANPSFWRYWQKA